MKTFLIDVIDNSTSQGHTSKFNASSYVGLQVLTIAKKAAVVITPAVMGKINIEFRGENIYNSIFSQIQNYSNLLFGAPRSEQGAAGNYSYYGAFLPFYHAGLPSAIHKSVGDSMNFYIEKAQESVDECKTYVYGVTDDLPEKYVPSFLAIKKTAPEQKIPLEMNNIATVMLSKPATTVFDDIQLLTDNDLKFVGTWEILKDFSNIQAKVETGIDAVLMDLVQKGNISEALCDSATILLTGGVGDFYYSTVTLKFDRARTEHSINQVVSKARSELDIYSKKPQTSEGVRVIESIQDVADITGQSPVTLRNWANKLGINASDILR